MAIAAAGVLVVTPDAALVKWGQLYLVSSDAPLLFWKNLATFALGIGMAIWLDDRAKWRRPLVERVLDGWLYFSIAAGCQAFIAVSFPIAFMLTYSANVMVLYCLSPLASAVLGWLVLGDPLPWRTIIALACSSVAILVMFAPQLVAAQPGSAATRVGDLVAIATGLVNSIFLVSVRAGLLKHPDLPVPLSSTAGILMGALAALFWGNVNEISSLTFFIPMLLDGLCIALILLAMSLAPRYTSASDIGLLSLLEVVLSPAWVCLFFGQTPPRSTVLGGTLLFLVVAAHELASPPEHANPPTDTARRFNQSDSNEDAAVYATFCSQEA